MVKASACCDLKSHALTVFLPSSSTRDSPHTRQCVFSELFIYEQWRHSTSNICFYASHTVADATYSRKGGVLLFGPTLSYLQTKGKCRHFPLLEGTLLTLGNETVRPLQRVAKNASFSFLLVDELPHLHTFNCWFLESQHEI